MDPVTAAALLLLLHRAGDGGEVLISPSHVTSMHSAPAAPSAGGKLLPPSAHCAIHFTDGRMVSVLEACAEVRKLLEEAGQR